MKKKEEYLDPDIVKDLEAIEQDEKYKSMPVPLDLKSELFQKIAEYDQAVEEKDEKKVREIKASVGIEETDAVSTYDGLSIEDQEALKLGQELLRMQKEQEEARADEQITAEEEIVTEESPQKVRRFKKYSKVFFLAAVFGVLIVGAGIVTVGDDMRWLVSEDKSFEEDQGISVDSDIESRLEVARHDEYAAYELADEIIGVPVVRLFQIDGVVYDSMEIAEDTDVVYLYYMYDEKVLTYNIVVNKNKLSHFENNDTQIIEEYIVDNDGVEIKIQVYEEVRGDMSYITFTHNNVHYSILTIMESEMVGNMVKSLHF